MRELATFRPIMKWMLAHHTTTTPMMWSQEPSFIREMGTEISESLLDLSHGLRKLLLIKKILDFSPRNSKNGEGNEVRNKCRLSMIFFFFQLRLKK